MQTICKGDSLLPGHPGVRTGTTFSDKGLKLVEQFPEKQVLMASDDT